MARAAKPTRARTKARGTEPRVAVTATGAGAEQRRALQPIARVEWVDPATLRANDYNPNRVFGPEMKLLKLSILEHGWTQPIVARRIDDAGEGGGAMAEVVDGFHRWTLASTDAEVRALTGGVCPVVFLDGVTPEGQKLATIRHNRARGQHGIIRMGEILRSLAEAGWDAAEIGTALQMEDEEVERLMDVRPSPAQAGKDHFGKGWAPKR